MLHIYSFHVGIIIFIFYPETVGRKCSLKKFSSLNSPENTSTGVSFLSSASNFINEETLAYYFPKPLTILAKISIADIQLGNKFASVSPPDLKPSYKDFLL